MAAHMPWTHAGRQLIDSVGIGRLALSSGAFQAGAVAGPIVAGFLLRHQLNAPFIAMLVAGCALMAVLAVALEKLISPKVNGIPDDLSPAKAIAAPTPAETI